MSFYNARFLAALVMPTMGLSACSIAPGLVVQDAVLEKNKLTQPAWVASNPGIPYERDGRVMMLIKRPRRQSLSLGIEQMEMALSQEVKYAWLQAEGKGQISPRLVVLKGRIMGDQPRSVAREDFYYEKVEGLSDDGQTKDVFYNLYVLVGLGSAPEAR